MIKKSATRVRIAWFFLGLLVLETLVPATAKALTSGPSQPETRQFAAAETANMVDLFTGDFKYNIPLLDIDGYPINLNYASGVGIDDEASWVGLGWNLNVGAINRGLRGLPDDASGDEVVSENYVKPKITVGGMVTGRVEIAGFSTDFASMGFNGSLSLSIFSDNYYGYGADIGVGTGVSLGMSYSGALTSGLNLGSGVSMNSSTQDGVSVSPNMSLSVKKNIDDMSSASAGISANLGYNTREGLKSITMGASFNTTTQYVPDDWKCGDPYPSATGGYSTSYSKTSFNTPAFYPKAQSVFRTQTNSYAFDIGGSVFFGYLSGGVNGYKTVRELANVMERHKAYGFMYAQEGKQDPAALMDFMREKDNPVVPNLPNLAIPIATPDLFSYSGQAGSGQFRLYRGGTATFADPFTDDITNVGALSAEYGFGTYFHGGFSYNKQQIHNRTGKWRRNNDFIAKGDYPSPANTNEEHAYFKIVGEQTRPDDEADQSVSGGRFFDRIKGTDLVRIGLAGKKLSDKLAKGNDATSPAVSAPEYRKTGRQIRRTPVMALTAGEREARREKHIIKKHRFHTADNFSADVCQWPSTSQPKPLTAQEMLVRKKHHFSELTVQNEDGTQMIYGLPVYNLKQQEITFSVDMSNAATQSSADKEKNLVNYSRTNGRINHKHLNTDQYYKSEIQPAYATSYLLTGVVSPEYQDLTGDGISDDDPGTAYKFNYSKVDGVYGWRSPLIDPTTSGNKLKAQHNKGQLADPNDDKGNIVYGEKELWYISSIESKTKIAFFITEDRDDALGVTDIDGASLKTSVRQKRLKEIRIFSKTDLQTPIKTVVFEYDYSLCPGTYNSIAGTRGKLTLTRVYFKYNGSDRGKYHPYVFTYDDNNNPGYNVMSADRWGNYKPASVNAADGFGAMLNDEFPYANRGLTADKYAKSWNLSKIELPSGGEINVEYESDDYAYVQNRRAMQMSRITEMVNDVGQATTNLHEAEGFKVTLPRLTDESRNADPVKQREWFLRNYLNGQPYLYAKLSVNISDQPQSVQEGYFDYIPCYAEIERVEYLTTGNSNIDAVLYFKKDKIGGIWGNPFTFAAWQKMRLEYPMYAYPGFKNRINDDRPVAAAVSALTNAIGNFSELKMNFNKRAQKKGFAQKVNLNKSFTRLALFQKDKNGGGSRVKSIRMSDKWNEMATGGLLQEYGQVYDYTITEEGVKYSSGVATFEPAVGADENPMRMPIPYNQEFKWALSNVFYLEEPIGESLFPSPQVGYRQVTVQPIGADNNPSDKMGYTVSEFYTAKEFPVQVDQTVPEKVESETKRWFPFFGGDFAHELYMSQGYLIKTNDMHGKPFREKVLSRGGEEVSSMEYKYNSRQAGGYQVLTGDIPTLAEHGKSDVIRQAVELYVDLREAETANDNRTYNAGVDVIPTFLSFPTPFPHIPQSKNNDYRLFRSASVLKTVEEYGVVLETVKTVNGSSIRSITELFDGKTGQPLVTKTQNEFEDWIYTVNIPAFYLYPGMGMAYKTQGMFIRGLKTMEDKGVIVAPFKDFLKPGDELLNLTNGVRYWVIESSVGNVAALRLIDEEGRVVNSLTSDVKVLRSGNRNKLGDVITTVVTTDPADIPSMFSNASSHNVLETKGTLYAEDWGRPTDCSRKVCPAGYNLGPDGHCYRPSQYDGRGYSISTHPDTWGDLVGRWGGALQPHDDNYNEGNYISEMPGQFWHNPDWSKFKWSGIWLNGIADQRWWGFEVCVNVPAIPEGYAVYAGMAVDDVGIFYVDGQPFYTRTGESSADIEYNFAKWHIQPVKLNNVPLTAGKHTFRVDAKNISGRKGVALELYLARSTDFAYATESSLNAMRIFHTRELQGRQDVNYFKIAANGEKYDETYTCPQGGTIRMCDGTPSCGMKDPGDCPDGYNKSPDGQSCIPIKTFDNNAELNLVEGRNESHYDMEGARIVDGNGGVEVISSPFWGGGSIFDNYVGRLKKVGTSMAMNMAATPKWVGFTYCFNPKYGNEFYLGYSAESQIRIYLNGNLIPTYNNPNKERQFNVQKIDLSIEQYSLRVEALAPANVNPVMAVEVYRGSLQQVKTGVPEIAFTTQSLYDYDPGFPPDYNSYVRSESGGYLRAKEWCGALVVDKCGDQCKPISTEAVLNPYLTGYLGNWAPWMEFVYMDKRNQDNVFDHSRDDINIRKAGTFKIAKPFIIRDNNGTWSTGQQYDKVNRSAVAHYPGWILSREATMFNNRMEELESVDALGRFSSARFGFRNTLPVAVAANARHTEIYYDSFEDYHYWKNCLAKPACEISQFDIRMVLGINATDHLEPLQSHTGKYSLKLGSGLQLKSWIMKPDYRHKPGKYLSNTDKGEFYRAITPWLGLWGFAPQENKKYIFSAWVKNSNNNLPGTHITVNINSGTNIDLNRKATVEGWSLVEGEFTAPAQPGEEMVEVTLNIGGGSNVLLDDIRIFPYDGHIKTYSYDDRTLRLMGELDENNYATFYEYDDEGTLNRVKKETDKGIITIKETRSANKKNPNVNP